MADHTPIPETQYVQGPGIFLDLPDGSRIEFVVQHDTVTIVATFRDGPSLYAGLTHQQWERLSSLVNREIRVSNV